jgi:hypothetical protein
MSDRPWLEDADPSLRAERALLKRLNAQQPPTGSAEQGWSALAAQIASPPAGPLHPTPDIAHAVKAGTNLVLAAKIAVGVAVTGAALWTGRALLKSDGASSTSGPHQPLNGPTQAPPVQSEGEPEGVTDKTLEGPSAKSPQPAGPARPTSSATTLAEEGRLLAKAHQLIQSGQAQQALEVLRLSESRYPHSVLSPEREVLTIEALGATGSSSAARQRAERFLKRDPNGAYTSRLKRFVE